MDLAGKIAGMPVYSPDERIEIDPGLCQFAGHWPDIAAYVDQAVSFKEAGWQAYKIHPPRDPDRDIKMRSRA